MAKSEFKNGDQVIYFFGVEGGYKVKHRIYCPSTVIKVCNSLVKIRFSDGRETHVYPGNLYKAKDIETKVIRGAVGGKKVVFKAILESLRVRRCSNGDYAVVGVDISDCKTRDILRLGGPGRLKRCREYLFKVDPKRRPNAPKKKTGHTGHTESMGATTRKQ